MLITDPSLSTPPAPAPAASVSVYSQRHSPQSLCASTSYQQPSPPFPPFLLFSFGVRLAAVRFANISDQVQTQTGPRAYVKVLHLAKPEPSLRPAPLLAIVYCVTIYCRILCSSIKIKCYQKCYCNEYNNIKMHLNVHYLHRVKRFL